MPSYTIAPAVQAQLDEATERWPNRSTASDGTIGDPAHASRTSDHNPAPDGKVHACDLTHDPANGCDNNRNAEAIKDDPRVKYVIWNRRIWNPSISRSWRPYTGSNPHDHHMHTSILDGPLEDSTADWFGDLSGEDFTIVDKQTKEYLDNSFAGIRQAQRRNRETQLAQGQILKKVLRKVGASQADIADLDKDLARIATDLHDG